MLTIYDKKVLRAHGFNDPSYALTRNEIEIALEDAKKLLKNESVGNMAPRLLTRQQIAVLENVFNDNGGVDNVTQDILAKQFKKPKRKIQVD